MVMKSRRRQQLIFFTPLFYFILPYIPGFYQQNLIRDYPGMVDVGQIIGHFSNDAETMRRVRTLFVLKAFWDLIQTFSILPLIYYLERVYIILPFVTGVIGSALEFAYAMTFHVGHLPSSHYEVLFVTFISSWIVFNVLIAPVMIKFKFYVLAVLFILYGMT